MVLRFLIFGFLFTLLWPPAARGQAQYTLSGLVRAAGTAETLPGATVAIPALGLGATTDEQGAYTLTLPAGRYQVVVSFIGYDSQTRDVNLTRNQRL